MNIHNISRGRHGYNQFADEGTAAERSLNKLLKAAQLITDKTEVPRVFWLCVLCSFKHSTSWQEADPRGQSGPQWESIRWSFLPKQAPSELIEQMNDAGDKWGNYSVTGLKSLRYVNRSYVSHEKWDWEKWEKRERDKNVFFIKPWRKTLFPQTPNLVFLCLLF